MPAFILDIIIPANEETPFAQAGKILMLGNIINPSDGYLDTPSIRPFLNDIVPTPDSVYADFTVSATGGFGAENITWGTPASDGFQGGQINGTVPAFDFDGGELATIYGFLIANGAGTEFKTAVRLPEPYAISEADQIVVVPRLLMP